MRNQGWSLFTWIVETPGQSKGNNMDINELLKLAMQCEFIRTDADRIIALPPGFLFSAVISSDGGGEADSHLYDGNDTSGRLLQDLYSGDELSFQYHWFPPVFFRFGLYVDIGTNVDSVTLQFRVKGS